MRTMPGSICLHTHVITHVIVERELPPVKWVFSLTGLAPLSLGPPDGGLAPSRLAQLDLLPKLRSLSLRANLSEIQWLPLRLKELYISNGVWGDVSPLTRITGLTNLRLRVLHGALLSLLSLTCLTTLRSLSLSCDSAPVGVLSTLTNLTYLYLVVYLTETPIPAILSDLVHLTRLSSLVLPYYASNEVALKHEDLECLGHLTRLTWLRLDGFTLSECVAGSSALVSLTGLVCLKIRCETFGMSLLSNLNVRALQWLYLGDVSGDVSVLQRATRLTWLELSWNWSRHATDYPPDLGPMLARISRLRRLSLYLHDDVISAKVFHLSPLLRALSVLTYLDYKGKFRVDSDLKHAHLCPICAFSCSGVPVTLHLLVLQPSRPCMALMS